MNRVFDPTRKFLNPEKVLFAAGLGKGQVFADLGAGSGFYTLAGAKIVGEGGQVYSVDILETALDHITAEARLKNVKNIKTVSCDLEQSSSCAVIPAGSTDVVLFANITHQINEKQNLFSEAYRLLKTGGRLVVIEWNQEQGPIGPIASQRITQTEISACAKSAAFKSAGNIVVDPYHFGLIYIK